MSERSFFKERVHELYSLRWQVEVVFKTWKSFYQLDRCKLSNGTCSVIWALFTSKFIVPNLSTILSIISSTSLS
ncbi:transposase [Shimazuella sp. KC615]|uniref:Transposase n=1 Tax=Shimazuella alba TaxID=2690964 RepID=A0A6I4VT67_9BACL|nr:transposase [Shimazuella alba]